MDTDLVAGAGARAGATLTSGRGRRSEVAGPTCRRDDNCIGTSRHHIIIMKLRVLGSNVAVVISHLTQCANILTAYLTASLGPGFRRSVRILFVSAVIQSTGVAVEVTYHMSWLRILTLEIRRPFPSCGERCVPTTLLAKAIVNSRYRYRGSSHTSRAPGSVLVCVYLIAPRHRLVSQGDGSGAEERHANDILGDHGLSWCSCETVELLLPSPLYPG